MLETKEKMYRYSDHISYSEAVKNEIEKKGGEEILTFISMYQTSKKFKENQSLRLFQKWTYEEVEGQSILTCYNENGKKVFQADVNTYPKRPEPIQLVCSEGELFTVAEWTFTFSHFGQNLTSELSKDPEYWSKVAKAFKRTSGAVTLFSR